MGTLTITVAGFNPVTNVQPANWPSYVVFPGGQNTNGSKTYTISDADWLSLMTWVAAIQFQATPATPSNPSQPATPTAVAILLAWVNIWTNGTKSAIQQFNTVPATAPPPISVS